MINHAQLDQMWIDNKIAKTPQYPGGRQLLSDNKGYRNEVLKTLHLCKIRTYCLVILNSVHSRAQDQQMIEHRCQHFLLRTSQRKATSCHTCCMPCRTQDTKTLMIPLAEFELEALELRLRVKSLAVTYAVVRALVCYCSNVLSRCAYMVMVMCLRPEKSDETKISSSPYNHQNIL